MEASRMEKHTAPFDRLPKIGLRNFKTALSATLCILLYSVFERDPTFACIGAVSGMGCCLGDCWKSGGNRLAGTVIGGLMGMGVMVIFLSLPPLIPQSELLSKSPFLFVGIMLLIYISVLLRVGGAIIPGAVVFYIVTLNVTQDTYISYALNRMLDTGVGVITSTAVEALLPRELFVALRAKATRGRDYFRAKTRAKGCADAGHRRPAPALPQQAEPESLPG
jgi:uncharacterized membrane protein YgaE (UPF0421/DUF939 family)